MFNRALKNFTTGDLALEFNKRIQNNMELSFVSDELLRNLLDTLEAEEQRRVTQDVLTKKVISWIKKRQGKQDEVSA